MFRRSERIVSQESGGEKTRYRITRFHAFGCCVYHNQVELEVPKPRYADARTLETTRAVPAAAEERSAV